MGGPLDALTIDGQFFRCAGEPWTAIESSDFSLFKRYLDGEDIGPVLDERRTIGFNLLRVWLLNQSVVGRRNNIDPAAPPHDGGIHPSQYPDFYERLTAFVRACATYGEYVELTVFTQTKTLMPNRDDQQRHLDRTADAVRDEPNVLIELVNENDQHDNAVDPDLRRPLGVVISRGSNGADRKPPRHDDPWGYELYHTNGLFEFQRKVGHNAMEWAAQSGRPCISNENTRYPDNDSSETHAYDAAMGAALLCAGSCFHSQGGKFSRLFDDDERRCAEAWVQGAKSIPLEFQRGSYRHREEFESANIIRAYSRTLSDGREYIIRIRK